MTLVLSFLGSPWDAGKHQAGAGEVQLKSVLLPRVFPPRVFPEVGPQETLFVTGAGNRGLLGASGVAVAKKGTGQLLALLVA